jgi:hypothetical protein
VSDTSRDASKAVNHRKPSKPSKASLTTSESTDYSYTEPPSFAYFLKARGKRAKRDRNASLYDFDKLLGRQFKDNNKEQAKSMRVTCERRTGISSLVSLHDTVSRRLRKIGLPGPVLASPPDRESPPSLVFSGGEHSFKSRSYRELATPWL